MTLTAAQTPGDAVIFPVRDWIKRFYKELPHAIAGQEEPIHQIRVAARRLRVMLPLAARKPKGRKVRRALKTLGRLVRAAGTSRDMDVCCSLFARTAAEHDDAVLSKTLLRKLRAARTRSHKRMSGALLDIEIARLRRDLKLIVSRGGEVPFTAIMRLRLLREEEGRAIVETLQRLGERFDPVALHDVRSRARRLRYADEFGAALLGSSPEAGTRFREWQDLLGEMHDAWVLAGWLSRQAAAAAKKGRAREGTALRRLAASYEDLSHHLHGKFLESNPMTTLDRALELMGRSASVA